MAETKKTNAPEETKEVLLAEKETEYGLPHAISFFLALIARWWH